jgi:hypothetical protein
VSPTTAPTTQPVAEVKSEEVPADETDGVAVDTTGTTDKAVEVDPSVAASEAEPVPTLADGEEAPTAPATEITELPSN